MKKNIIILMILLCYFAINAYGNSYDYQPEINFARKAIKDGFFDLAESKLTAILYLDIPKSIEGEARLLLGRVYFAKSDPSKALSEFNYVMNEFSNTDFLANAYYWTAEVYFDQGHYVQALSGYQTVINDYPVSEYVPFAIYSQAWCYEKMGEYQMAVDSYKELINKFSQKELAIKGQYKIAEILYRNFDNEKAKDEILNFINKYPVSEKIFDAYYMLGDVYYRIKDNENAIDAFLKSLKGGTNKPWRASAEYKLAKLLFQKGDLIKSDYWFAKAVQDSSDKSLICSALLYSANIRQKDLNEQTGLFVNGEAEMISFYEKVSDETDVNELAADAFYLLAEYFYSSSKYAKAVEVYKKALMTLPKVSISDKLHYGYAWSLLRSMDSEGALTEFIFVTDNSNNDELKASSLFSIADIEKKNGNISEASIVYDKILKKYSGTSFADQAQYEIGVILKDSLRIDAAIMAFRALEENFPDSKLIEKTLFQLGDLYSMRGDYRLANLQFDQIINSSQNSQIKNEAMLHKAIAFYNNEEYMETINTCDKIEEVNPEIKVRAEYYDAWANYKLGKEQEALKKFTTILTKDQAKDLIPGIKLWFGQYYYENGEFDSAIQYFQEIIDGFPATSASNDAAYWLGWVFFDSGREQESLDQFRKLIKLYPESSRAPQAMLALGDIFIKKGETELAIKELEALVQKYPENKITNIAMEKIGTSYKIQGKYFRAIDYYKMALTDENSEMNSQIQFDIAECYDKAGLTDEAIEEYLNVEYQYPKSEYWVMRALFRCAGLFEKEGKIERAIVLYRKLSDRNGKETELSKAKVKSLQQYIRKGNNL